MTLAFERSRAVNSAREFLVSLMDAGVTPRVPLRIRQQARALLRHYPTRADMDLACRHCPAVFSTTMVPPLEREQSDETAAIRASPVELKLLEGEAFGAIGPRAWKLVRRYGKVMAGPLAGRYVASIPYDDALTFVRALAKGETVQIHLMHRHQSCADQASELRFRNGTLLMVFPDRTEPAW